MRRIKPRISVTLDPVVHRRLHSTVKLVPGATMSAIVNELLELSLPVLEDMGKALREAMNESSGQLDEARAKDALAKFAGQQILRFAGDVSDALKEESIEEVAAQ